MELIDIDIEQLFSFLEPKDVPVMEIEVLRYITGTTSMPRENGELFRIHFSLYHAFYRLKEEVGPGGYYLHLDPMRIRLLRIPGNNTCHHYETNPGKFCDEPVAGSLYCQYHSPVYSHYGSSLLFDPLLEFYENPENISFGKSDLLKKLLNGVVVFISKKGELDQALKFFGLTHPGKKIIQKRYRELARKYHPDMLNGDDSMMKRLNRSYYLLKEVYVV
ncbi:MAG: hypothetical protein GY754_35680 [bacterium]|nr:hypothetical protein [bacterium]